MSDLSKIFQKAKWERLISYFLYDDDSRGDIFDNDENVLEKSYDSFFGELESMYADADRHDNRLFDLVADFAEIHEAVYFEAGVLMGFQLYKNIETGYQKHIESDVLAALAKKIKKESEG